MFAISPILCFFLIFHLLRKKEDEKRTALLLTSVIWGVLVVLSTELLSLISMINFGGISTFWLALTTILIIIQQTDLHKPLPSYKVELSHLEISLLTCVAFIVTIVGFIAFMAPPNNWDSMTTHMSRISHWIQNQTIENYPSSMLKQLNYPPWAAYVLVHFQILLDGDRLANFVQWFSMMGSLIGVTLITRELGGLKRAQILACIAAATIPMGILQASSTQNDYVVTFWLICFIYFALRLCSQPNLRDTLTAGASLGLAFLIKGTAYLYSVPFILWFFIVGIKNFGKKFIKSALLLLLVALCVNLGYFARNYALTQTLVPPSESTHVVNQSHSPNAFLSVASRNVGMHLQTPSKLINSGVEKTLRLFHKIIRISYNDKRTTFGEYNLNINRPSFHEDHTGNFLHTILILVCIFLFFYSKYQRRDKKIYTYFLCVLGAAALFAFIVKWAPWHSRYHLPLFVLFTPFVGIILSRIPNQKAVTVICIVLILCSMPWVWGNKTRSFFKKRNIFNSTRMDQYFYNKKPFQDHYTKAVLDVIEGGCTHVGLSLSADSWEYPFWALFKEHTSQRYRIEHVNVDNISSLNEYPRGRFFPCAVIDDDAKDKPLLYIEGLRFKRESLYDFVGVFRVK